MDDMNHPRKLAPLLAWIVIAPAVLVVFGVLSGKMDGGDTATHQKSPGAVPITAADKPVAVAPGVTRENYDKLEEGMTYQQAVAILGEAGERLSASESGGMKTEVYAWEGNSTGANMNAMFRNDRLMSKSQFGLE